MDRLQTMYPHQADAWAVRTRTMMDLEEDDEFTYHMPTGSGKTRLMVKEMNAMADQKVLVVFPRLALHDHCAGCGGFGDVDGAGGGGGREDHHPAAGSFHVRHDATASRLRRLRPAHGSRGS